MESNPNLERALLRTQGGDPDAYRDLVRQFSDAAFAAAVRIVRNATEAEDIVQESFLRAYRRIHEYRSSGHFGSSLKTIATNLGLDGVRRRARWKTEAIEGDGGSRPLASEAIGPAAALFGEQIRMRIDAALEDLTPNERAAFTLRHYEGLPIREISDAMGLKENSTKNHIFRAVRKLRTALQPLMESAQ